MSQKLCNRLLFFLPTVVLGGLSLVLHMVMLGNCFDEKGLLISGNIFGWLLRIILVAYVLMLGVSLRRIGGEGSYGDNFSRCLWRGGMMVAAGALLALSVPRLELTAPWQQGLSYGAAVCMVYLGLLRMVGKKPVFGPGGVICLLYMLLLVNNYRHWSSSPKVYVYAYQLLALVLSMLCSFHRTCCDGGIIQRKKFLFTAFSGAFCAIAAMATAAIPELYLATALWNMGCVCTTATLPPDPEEEIAELPVEEPEGQSE